MEKLIEKKALERNEEIDRSFLQRQIETNNWDYIKDDYYKMLEGEL